MKRLTLVLLLLTAVAPALAEEEAADPGLEAMQAISFFAGEWEGEGWMRRGPGEPVEFRGSEKVESRLGGRVLIIEGLHQAKESDEVVHHALATVSWDPEAGHYRFRSHLEDGRAGDYTGRLEDGAFIWGFAVPRGEIRYTIRIADGHWSEIGEFSADGTQWSQVFGMELDQVTE